MRYTFVAAVNLKGTTSPQVTAKSDPPESPHHFRCVRPFLDFRILGKVPLCHLPHRTTLVKTMMNRWCTPEMGRGFARGRWGRRQTIIQRPASVDFQQHCENDFMQKDLQSYFLLQIEVSFSNCLDISLLTWRLYKTFRTFARTTPLRRLHL
jgi:hypothetical protein